MAETEIVCNNRAGLCDTSIKARSMNIETINALTSAFYRDPLTEFLLPAEESRLQPLSVAMEFLLGLSLNTFSVETADLRCAGVIGAVPPGRYPLPLSRTLFVVTRLALKSLSLRTPFHVIKQWIRIFSQFDGMHPTMPHWYVVVLGVHAAHQGKGLGGKLLGSVLEQADAEKVAVYLESSNPRNLDFYKRHGFEVIDEIVPAGNCPPVRGLLRKPMTVSDNLVG